MGRLCHYHKVSQAKHISRQPDIGNVNPDTKTERDNIHPGQFTAPSEAYRDTAVKGEL